MVSPVIGPARMPLSSHPTRYTPTVLEGHAFREISQDFSKPAEIFREAIANALDAYAQRIWLRVQVVPELGREKVVIDLADDGIGMTAESIKSFLNLSDSSKPDAPPSGRIPRRMTGFKGHGTKVYFNSQRVEVLTRSLNEDAVWMVLENPRGALAGGELPVAEITPISPEELRAARQEWGFPELRDGSGTCVRVTGYHDNSRKGLEHLLLLDYVRWFTRWGSWEPKLREVTGTMSDEVLDLSQCQLFLRGLGKAVPTIDERVPFGHVFPPADCTDMEALREKDDADPLKFFVRTWGYAGVPLQKHAGVTLDFLFAIEGEGARREYNDMLRRQRKPRRPGDYLSEERYGLWLGRFYIPKQRFNSWIAEKSEYTRMHAFVDCEALSLTANRGSVENTPQELLEDIESTVKALFAEIQQHPDYERFHDELAAVERQRLASKEQEDYRRRIKRLSQRQAFRYREADFLSPDNDTEMLALVSALQALSPDFLPFTIREFDTRFGYDGLATRTPLRPATDSQHLFVEFKAELRPELNHSFSQLEAVVCWNSRLKDGAEFLDLSGQAGVLNVRTDPASGQKVRVIEVAGQEQAIEVYSIRELLAARDVQFRSPGD